MKFNYKDTCLVSDKEIDKLGNKISSYVDHLIKVSKTANYDFPESSINLPFDNKSLKEIKNLSRTKDGPELKYIIVVGIGGSNLGAQAIYDAVFSHFDVLENYRLPKIIFADTIDPEFMEKLVYLLSKRISNPKEFVIIPISKSGTTVETVVNLEIIYSTVKKFFFSVDERIIVITDYESKLWKKAKEKNISAFCLPNSVGGRYSVFSAVGLIPLSMVGINIEELLNGARQMRNQCLNKNISKNPALISAIISYAHFKKGKCINNSYFFKPAFNSIGSWYRQLMGESIGKEKNLDGKIVNTGITPIVSIGSTDLHSVTQLFLGGPNDKTTTFISTQKELDIPISNNLSWEGLADIIKGKSLIEVLYAELSGTQAAYKKKNLPFIDIILKDSTEKSIGEFLQFKMMEMMYLGKLMNVNAFDQPSVEHYKVETNCILEKNKD